MTATWGLCEFRSRLCDTTVPHVIAADFETCAWCGTLAPPLVVASTTVSVVPAEQDPS